jgi:catechol 2,3-dioxygenase-like lactoylglutathione lyase family enzyme
MASSERGRPLGRLDHVGVVVADLAQAKGMLEEVLGLPCRSEAVLAEKGLRIAFFEAGDADIELVEVRDPAARRERLGDATARIEHLALRVDDLEEAASRVEGDGVRLAGGVGAGAPPEPFQNAGARSLFTRPETSAGIVLQLLQPEATDDPKEEQ